MKKYTGLLTFGICLIAASLYGCMNSDAGQTHDVAFTIESSGNQTGIPNQQLQIITSDSQYSSLLSTISINGNPPSVDFSSKELVAVFTGTNVGCFLDRLSSESVIETANTVTITVKRAIFNPPPGMGCTLPVIINSGPYVFISMPKTNKLVSLSIE
ncbi:MAG: hypothetical protein ACYDC8_07190 [Gammaproteobacteria bacterium]